MALATIAGAFIGFYTYVKVSIAKLELKITELQNSDKDNKERVERVEDSIKSDINIIHRKLDEVLLFLAGKRHD